MNPHKCRQNATVRSIQTRLFVLLLRAFAMVVLITLFFVFGLTGFVLSYPTQLSPLNRLPIVTRLETYYQVRGTWEGVAPMFHADSGDTFWQQSILLDTSGHILVFRGSAASAPNGVVYTPTSNEIRVPLEVNNQSVGELVFLPGFVPAQGRVAFSLLAPVGMISIFLALLTMIIGMLLVRRVVIPLSEVVAASRAVAAGDLSTRVRVTGPDDLRTLSDSFNHMADALERSDLERRNMLADIAHELRTPLTVIRGRLEGIVDGIYPPEGEQLAPALEETYLLERLVDDLRLLTLAETRQLPFDRREINLSDLAARVVDLFGSEAEDKGIRLTLEADSQPAQVQLDPQRTGQVVSNLVGNALRYTPEGGNIWVTVTQTQDEAVLTVSDNGPGVAADELPHLFDRFWRSEKSRSRASGGAGLGLAITRHLVEAQGGKITARNRAGGGLEMQIEFLRD